MREILDEKNLSVIKEQLKSPCVEEVAAFDKFIEFMDNSRYDIVIFDTAPTGHTIRLLELPAGWSETLKENASTCIGPGASLQEAKSKYEKAISYLQDSNKTSFIFVLRPENSSILETKRSAEALGDLGFKTAFLIVNGILPKEACTDEFFKKKSEEEQKMINKINSEFKTEKLFYPLMDSEVSGLTLLNSVAEFLYEGKKRSTKIELESKKIDKFEFVNENKIVDVLLVPLNGKRYVFFTGKGGVGKSTIACATAVYLADKGFKTLIVTTDPASHLYEIFKQKIEHEPQKIVRIDNLYAARIGKRYGSRNKEICGRGFEFAVC
jgi:arsenite-transporting ATPase